jgi:hypothetical protein
MRWWFVVFLCQIQKNQIGIQTLLLIVTQTGPRLGWNQPGNRQLLSGADVDNAHKLS